MKRAYSNVRGALDSQRNPIYSTLQSPTHESAMSMILNWLLESTDSEADIIFNSGGYGRSIVDNSV